MWQHNTIVMVLHIIIDRHNNVYLSVLCEPQVIIFVYNENGMSIVDLYNMFVTTIEGNGRNTHETINAIQYVAADTCIRGERLSRSCCL